MLEFSDPHDRVVPSWFRQSTHSKELNMSALRSLAKLESMESRLLLSFASLNSHGILSVVGTGGNDSITVQFSGTKVQAILNGQTKSFNKSDVKGIFAEGFGGNDRISNKTSLPSTLLGDAGNDTFVGGSANDEIDAGSGNDHFDGGLGMNAIHEGDGNDAFDYSSTAGGHFNLIYPYSGVLPFDGLDVAVTKDHGAIDFAEDRAGLNTFIGSPKSDQVTFALDT